MKNKLYPEIETLINNVDISKISSDRKQLLQSLVAFVQAKKDANQEIKLNFICTHNSRRSHLSQVWAQTMASYFNMKEVTCYSGGTEATAVFPMVIETLKNTGFHVSSSGAKENPVYEIKYAENDAGVMAFSKTFDDVFNPTKSFAAVLTCSQADKGCPFIAGAEKRIPITYEDPKAFDNTPQQTAKYKERSLQIATELYYVFSMIQ